MRLIRCLTLLAACVALVTACAPVSQMPLVADDAVGVESETMRRLVVEQHLADVDRLHRIVYPILAANTQLCGTRVAYGTGFLVESRFDQLFEYRTASVAAGLDDRLSIVAIAPNSPAQQAGLQPGDRVIAVNGVALAPTYRGREDLAERLADAPGAAVTFGVERAGGHTDVTMRRERVCDMQSRVVVSEIVNAYAYGSELVATTGLLRFLADDAEFAVVAGHEIAHNVQHHVGTGVGNPGIASMFDFLANVWSVKPNGEDKQTSISQAYEAEADYVGLYLIARAGFSTAAAQNVYRRFAVSIPSSITARQGSSHPASPARVVMLAEAAREIEAKRTAGLPLLPERK